MQYLDIFERKIGKVSDIELKLLLRKEAKPVLLKVRRVPFALSKKVDEELDRLESEGIITPTAISEWS